MYVVCGGASNANMSSAVLVSSRRRGGDLTVGPVVHPGWGLDSSGSITSAKQPSQLAHRDSRLCLRKDVLLTASAPDGAFRWADACYPVRSLPLTAARYEYDGLTACESLDPRFGLRIKSKSLCPGIRTRRLTPPYYCIYCRPGRFSPGGVLIYYYYLVLFDSCEKKRSGNLRL